MTLPAANEMPNELVIVIYNPKLHWAGKLRIGSGK